MARGKSWHDAKRPPDHVNLSASQVKVKVQMDKIKAWRIDGLMIGATHQLGTHALEK